MAIFSQKRAIAEFGSLDPKILAQIPDVHIDPTLLAAAAKLHGFEAALKETLAALNTCYDDPGGAAVHYAVDGDIGLLLAGNPVESLVGPSRESQRAGLLRRKFALEGCIPSAKCAIAETECRVIQNECKALESVAQKFAGAVLSDFESLERDLKALAVFYQVLSMRGFKANLRPSHWQLTNLENQLLFGGNGNPALSFYIAQRRKTWVLDTK